MSDCTSEALCAACQPYRIAHADQDCFDAWQAAGAPVPAAASDPQAPESPEPPPVEEPAESRYFDVGALLDGGMPDPPEPVLMRRDDGKALFYAGQVNVVFGDPEAGKTLLVQAAVTEALNDGRRVLVIDMDHNGPQATVYRLLDMGAKEDALRNADLFRYVEPEDADHLKAVIQDMKWWRPAVAVVDSIGELLPLLRLSSNSPDDFTSANARVLKPLAMAGAAVLAIDHLPKNRETRASGQTGTAAKRRAIGGVSLRVTVNEPFAPGRKGSAWLAVNKDRHGGLRRWCPAEGPEPPAGLFILDGTGHRITCSITAPQLGDAAKMSDISAEDLAALDRLDPPPASVRDVKDRLKWRSQRASDVLREWRSLRSRTDSGEQGTPEDTGGEHLPFDTAKPQVDAVPRSRTHSGGTGERADPGPATAHQWWKAKKRGEHGRDCQECRRAPGGPDHTNKETTE